MLSCLSVLAELNGVELLLILGDSISAVSDIVNVRAKSQNLGMGVVAQELALLKAVCRWDFSAA